MSSTFIEKTELTKLSKIRFIELLKQCDKFKVLKLVQLVETVGADLDQAKELNINFGDPLFYVRNNYIDENNDTIGITHMYHRGDRFRYKADINNILESRR